MFVYDRTFKLSTQTEYTFFARKVLFCKCFPARNQ